MPMTSPLQTRVATVAELFSSAHYIPAAVQRDYQWEAQECRILMADLDRAFQPLVPTQGAEADGEEEEDLLESDLISGTRPSGTTRATPWEISPSWIMTRTPRSRTTTLNARSR